MPEFYGKQVFHGTEREAQALAKSLWTPDCGQKPKDKSYGYSSPSETKLGADTKVRVSRPNTFAFDVTTNSNGVDVLAWIFIWRRDKKTEPDFLEPHSLVSYDSRNLQGGVIKSSHNSWALGFVGCHWTDLERTAGYRKNTEKILLAHGWKSRKGTTPEYIGKQ